MGVAAGVLFTQVNNHAQMSHKAGMKRFGDRALAAMISKYEQLDEGVMPGKTVFGCIDPKNITMEERKRAIEAVNLIKRKDLVRTKGELVQTEVNKKDIRNTEKEYLLQQYP